MSNLFGKPFGSSSGSGGTGGIVSVDGNDVVLVENLVITPTTGEFAFTQLTITTTKTTNVGDIFEINAGVMCIFTDKLKMAGLIEGRYSINGGAFTSFGASSEINGNSSATILKGSANLYTTLKATSSIPSGQLAIRIYVKTNSLSSRTMVEKGCYLYVKHTSKT